jgi:hypothetical protein
MGTDGGQSNDTSKVDPMEQPRRTVPYGIGLKVHLRHWRLACSPGPLLFGRLPVEVLFVCLCVRFGGVHYAIAMVRRSIKRVELHRA